MGKFGFDRRVSLNSKEGALLFMALIIMLYTVLRLISVGIHEVLGHGLFIEAFGGEFYATYISPGGGFAMIDFPENVGRAPLVLVFLAGIIVEFIFGLIILYFIYPRTKKFMTGLILLVFSEALLVHSAFYLVLGTYIRDGDSFKAAKYGNIHEGFFIVMGLALGGMFILLISVRVIKFLSRHMTLKNDRAALVALSYFWLPSLLIILTSIILPSDSSSGNERFYGIIYGILFTLMVLTSIYLISKLSLLEFKVSEEQGIQISRVVSTLFVFLIALALWLAVFGPSSSTAHGVLLKDPPEDLEFIYVNGSKGDYTVGNVEVTVNSNDTLTIEVRQRVVFDQKNHSGLEHKIWDTYNERPYWPNYVYTSRRMARIMFGMNVSQSEELTFDTELAGTVWAGGEEHDYARVCTTTFNSSLIELNQTDELNLTIRDPWMIGSTPGYIDMMTIRWDSNFTLLNYSSHNISYNFGNISQNYIGWQNAGPSTSPAEYNIILRRLPDR